MIPPLELQPDPPPLEAQVYQLHELARYHDRTFITYAYAALTKRAPTPEELVRDLDDLRSGRRDKVDIIESLLDGSERPPTVRVVGLRSDVWRRASRWPIVGYAWRLLRGLASLPLHLKHQQRFEAYSLGQQEKIADHMNGVIAPALADSMDAVLMLSESLQDYVLSLEESLASMAAQQEQLKVWVTDHQDQVEAKIAAQTGVLEATISAQHDRLDEKISVQAERLNAKISAQEERLDAKINAQQERLEATIDAQQSQLEANNNTHRQELDKRLNAQQELIVREQQVIVETQKVVMEQLRTEISMLATAYEQQSAQLLDQLRRLQDTVETAGE